MEESIKLTQSGRQAPIERFNNRFPEIQDMDPDDNLRDAIRSAAIKACDCYDISIHDVDDIRIAQVDEGTFDAKVPVSGRVLFDELVENQGPLLCIKDSIAISLKGIADDRLLLEADL